MNPPSRLPVTLLTGFLGSGKTTLLHKALADPRMAHTAVIINEIGEVGIDHLLVGKLDDDAVLLKSGCVCCGLKNDLADTLKSLYSRRASGQFPPFERVIVETTGMADPTSLLRLLLSHEPINSWYSVRGVVTTVDTLLPLDPQQARKERIRQIAVADHLVWSKTDLAPRKQVEAVIAAARRLNARANCLKSNDESAVMQALLDHTRYPVVDTLTQHSGTTSLVLTPAGNDSLSHEGVSSFCLYADAPLPWPELVHFFRKVAISQGSRLLRMKGLLAVIGADKPIVVHGVEHFLFPETFLEIWPDEDPRSRLVFIGESLDRREIEDAFQNCINSAFNI